MKLDQGSFADMMRRKGLEIVGPVANLAMDRLLGTAVYNPETGAYIGNVIGFEGADEKVILSDGNSRVSYEYFSKEMRAFVACRGADVQESIR